MFWSAIKLILLFCPAATIEWSGLYESTKDPETSSFFSRFFSCFKTFAATNKWSGLYEFAEGPETSSFFSQLIASELLTEL